MTAIPSPSQAVWHLGPLPIRAYSLLMVLAVVVGIWVTRRRWIARGGEPGTVGDIATWAVPFGVIGARIYHLATDWQQYFGPGKDPLRAFAIWEGGISIWGAVAGGALGAWLACRRRGIPLRDFADAVAPGIAFGQAIARWGNWFNQELYGGPTTLPWALEIDPAHRPPGLESTPTYHPAFLYESLWNLGVAGLVLWAERRFRLDRGRVFALYAAAYTAGRAWIEWLRVDPAPLVLGLRFNVWTALLVFCAAIAYLVCGGYRKRRPEPGKVDRRGR
ncbi:prolipoprotein diacylglyceryl transferase [Nonomuraea solani]|uniref:Phosphatidylglycerol--prolipoprotein diacylglyceryl transferase n=1 Tax=Nonomuraea solani TaxID=1144553 RepID=A0A1H6EK14_9ACTN|nr:prolipoprotein diacylglyceryl transferase [Nonomuraea solani]SEG97693.1 prolipoprotein diacylglyceryl transferase [Nonomuraea solani]